MSKYFLDHLDELESEAIFILREAYAQFENPLILFSGGKDSILLTHLSQKAFSPIRIPFPLMHIDTGHNFPETINFRDKLVNKLGVQLIVGSVQDAINEGRVYEEKGNNATRNELQIVTLLDALVANKIDCAIGGGRRDEEKSRAKERVFSHRDEFGQWTPKNQRPELWNIYNGRMNNGEHFRVFPLSNWTEIDVWNYIKREGIEIPSLYFAHNRKVVFRNSTWISFSDFLKNLNPNEILTKKVRFRTLGDITITGGIESDADTIDKIISEVSFLKNTERGNRSDDKRSDSSMEDRKKQGYF